MTTTSQSNDDLEAVIDDLEEGDRIHIDITAGDNGDPEKDEPLIVDTGERLVADTATVVDDDGTIDFDKKRLVDGDHSTNTVRLDGDSVIAVWPLEGDGWVPIQYVVGFVDDLEVLDGVEE